MILIGQYDSPFVRRVGIALTLYKLPFEHRPWSVFGDTDKIKPLNPLVRVPTLVLDDGDVVSESHSILDYLDSLVPAAERLFPVAEPTRHRALRVATLATGLCEQAVSVFYERRFHKVSAEALIGRRSMQMRGTAAALEADRAARPGAYWFGERIGHADIAVAAMARFTSEALPGLIPIADHPALADHCRRLEALPVFQAISQPFMPPA